MDFDSDPQLRILRDEFIATFTERTAGLDAALKNLDASLTEVRFIAHKLAGAAGSYGFQSLTDAGTALDDVISLTPKDSVDLVSVRKFTEYLRDMILAALKLRADPVELRKDQRYRDLIAAAESLLSEATS